MHRYQNKSESIKCDCKPTQTIYSDWTLGIRVPPFTEEQLLLKPNSEAHVQWNKTKGKEMAEEDLGEMSKEMSKRNTEKTQKEKLCKLINNQGKRKI